MSLNAHKMRLTALTRDLWVKWEHTRDCWRDAKSQEFEQKYLQELVAGVERAATVIDQLEHLVTKVRNDCE